MNWTLLPLSPEEAARDEEPEAAPQRERVAVAAPAVAADGAAAAAEAAARAAAESLTQAVAETLAELVARALADLVMELLLRIPPAPSSAAEPAGNRVWTSRSSRLRQPAAAKEIGAPPSRSAGADIEAKGGTTSGAARSSEEAPVATMGAVASMRPGCLSSTSTTATSATPVAAAPPAPPAPSTEPQGAAAAPAETAVREDPSELGASLVDTTDGSEALEEDDDDDDRSQPPPDHDDEDTGLSDGEAGEATSSSSSDAEWESPPVLQPWTRFAAFATFMEPWHARAWLGLAAWQEAANLWLTCVKDRRAMWGSLVFLSIRLRSCRRRAFRSLRTALGATPSAQRTPLLPSQKDSARS